MERPETYCPLIVKVEIRDAVTRAIVYAMATPAALEIVSWRWRWHRIHGNITRAVCVAQRAVAGDCSVQLVGWTTNGVEPGVTLGLGTVIQSSVCSLVRIISTDISCPSGKGHQGDDTKISKRYFFHVFNSSSFGNLEIQRPQKGIRPI